MLFKYTNHTVVLYKISGLKGLFNHKKYKNKSIDIYYFVFFMKTLCEPRG
jgi:hypothetical protein